MRGSLGVHDAVELYLTSLTRLLPECVRSTVVAKVPAMNKTREKGTLGMIKLRDWMLSVSMNATALFEEMRFFHKQESPKQEAWRRQDLCLHGDYPGDSPLKVQRQSTRRMLILLMELWSRPVPSYLGPENCIVVVDTNK
jgi:hypothetical protein